jgi:hypothetical protein
MNRLITASLIAVSLASSASAQVLYGTIVGNVTDPSQGAIADATVAVENKATGYRLESKTDDRGAYNFVNVPPGNYDVRVTAPGFATFDAVGIPVTANTIARIDAGLRVGQVSETVTVGAEVAQLQTDRSDLHTDISAREATQIPLSGYRNFQSLIDLVPGANPSNFQNASTDSPARALTTNVNGASRNNNNNRIDGAASVMTWLPHHSLYVPPLESIETVNVSTNSFDAEQGLTGGAAITVITKSGTNDFHGVAFWYHANHAWGAKNLFFNPNSPAGPGTPQRIDNQYGGTFGGPIIRDKLFFFGSWEGTTTAERGNGLLSVPTAQVRGGNFQGLTTVFDPLTGNTANGQGRTPFANNQIPMNRFASASNVLLGMLPLPNTGTGQAANFFASVPYYFKRDMIDGKVNWTPNSKANIFAKYSMMLAPVTAGVPLGEALGGYPGGAAGAAGIGTGNNTTKVFGGGISYVISPTILFDANFGGTHMDHNTEGPDYGKNIGLDVLRIPGTNGPDIRQSGFPIFNISGYTSFGNTNNWSPVVRNDRVYTYVANLNVTKGAHNIRFGLDFIQHQMNHWQPEIQGYSPRGGFNFNSNFITALAATPGEPAPPAANNFNAFGAFLLGLPSAMGKAYQFYDPMSTREFQQAYYIRDNWQVNRKLNFTIGTRLERFPIMNRGEFGIERYDPNTNKVYIGGRGGVDRNANSFALPVMWAPRIGMAFRATEKTVFRVGYGISNDPYPMSRPLRSPYPAVIVDELVQTNGFVPAGSLATGLPTVRFPDVSSGIIDIPNTVSTNSMREGEFRRGYIQSYNATIQQDLGKGFVLQTGYVGTRSIRAAVTYFNGNAGLIPGAGVNGRPLRAPFGVGVDRNFFTPMGYQRYDGWQTNLQKRYSSGFFMTASYTWSKTISTIPGGANNTNGLGQSGGNSDNGLAFYVPSAFSRNRALAAFDRAHVFASAATYDLPFGKNKPLAQSGFAAALLGGWQINGNLSVVSGNPFTVLADGGALNAPGNVQVADQIADARQLGGVGLGNPYYDTSSFRAPVGAQFGNMGIYNLRGPGFFNLNAGVFRRFAFTERVDLQFRAEGLNVTNTPQLQNPNPSVTSPANFMAITAANQTQRTIRFGLRLGF